jgi:hypothetical protein
VIPQEVADIASLIWPYWPDDDQDDEDTKQIIAAAYRIYNAGYRKPADLVGGPKQP